MLTLHVAGMRSFGGFKGTLARVYEKTMSERLLGRADGLAAVSQAVSDWAAEYTTKEVPVVPNGVDLDVFHPNDRPRREGIRFVYVGRLIANKGPHILLDAFDRLGDSVPGAHLIMVGDGPMRRRLERFVGSAGLGDRVSFIGMRPDVAEILRDCDVFVRPSLVEGMPLTALEALATGLPVIATNVGGTSEVVEHGVTGMVAEPGNAEAVSKAMALLGGDEHIRRRMSQEALARRGRFSWDKTADTTERLLTELAMTGSR
jgi:glycosyltransferase involved in cell wall biosynthesis